jgi:hypothetical protein
MPLGARMCAELVEAPFDRLRARYRLDQPIGASVATQRAQDDSSGALADADKLRARAAGGGSHAAASETEIRGGRGHEWPR